MFTTTIAPKKTIRKPKSYTLAEYLDKEEMAVNKHQFFNGKIQQMAGAKAKHNQIALQVASALLVSVKKLSQKYKVYNSDQKIYIASENIALYPDALVISEKPEFYEGREDLITNPLLIVEVLSKSTQGYDRGEKFMLYQRCPSFQEYILIEQETLKVESWCRIKENTWERTFETDRSKSLAIRSIGVELSLEDVYSDVEIR